MNKSFATILTVLFALSPVVFFLMAWNSFPQRIVVHFAINKEFENIQTKKELFSAITVIASLAVLVYLILVSIHKVDPKVTDETPRTAFNKLGAMLCLFLTVLNYYLLLTAKNQWTINTNVLVGFTGLMVCLIGNYMNNIRPNYIAGIRLPWTLNDPENWRKTHHLASRMWFIAGILILIFSFWISEEILLPIMIAAIIIITVIPGIYSFKIYRSQKIKLK